MKLYELLTQAQKESTASLVWDRHGDTIWISTVGYQHMEHSETEKLVLKLGYKYDFTKKVGEFNRENGRTETYFTKRKESK